MRPRSKEVWIIVLVGVILCTALATRPLATTVRSGDREDAKNGTNRYTRAYSLARGQAEALAALLRTDLPDETLVTTEECFPHSPGVRVLITAPKRVHDVVAPFVELVVADAAARKVAQARRDSERLEEAALLSEGIKKEEIDKLRERRRARNVAERKTLPGA